jgi:serine/threonine protein kinase
LPAWDLSVFTGDGVQWSGKIADASGCAVLGVKRPQSVIRFERFELDLRSGELRRDGAKSVRLSEQPFRILVLLLERPLEVVTREELRKKLWPNDTIVEFEHSISAAMNRLRQALGDSAEKPHYIETLARRGYRWMVPVEREPSTPELSKATASLAAVSPESLIGKKVSHYRVLELLGAGGMGVVYKAEDIKLGRRVALKFLPEELTKDPVALARFEREARSASSLDHPNICAIHEFEEHEGQPFIVMQLLEGQTLRERIAAAASQRTFIPLDEIQNVAIQICAGLEAAHQKGIIHRDIKPANIFITSRGEAKILDFGLAKLRGAMLNVTEAHDLDDAGSSLLSTMPTSSAVEVALSRTGQTMGTASYMSPEQIRCEELDGRTDMFSLGLVLYEMATSRQAFAGNTAALVHDAILHRGPTSARALNPKLPLRVEQIINRCLEKDRESRYQAAAEVCADLKQLDRQDQLALKDHWVNKVTAKRLRSGLAAALVMSLFGTAIWRFSWHHAEAPLPPLEIVPLTGLSGSESTPAFSPDGSKVAFAFKDAKNDGIYIAVVGGEKPLRVTNGNDFCPAWSPNGRQIAFLRNDNIYVVPTLGGSEHALYSGAGTAFCCSLHWSPDGRVIAFSQGHPNHTHAWIALLSVDDLTTRPLTSPSNQDVDVSPSISPDGSSVAFIRSNAGGASADLYIAPLNGGASKRLTYDGRSVGQLSWTPNGREIVFHRSLGGLWRIPASGGTAEPVAGLGSGAESPSIASKGNQLAYAQTGLSNWKISRVDLKDDKHAAGAPVVVTSGKGIKLRPTVSPDGQRIAFESDRLGYAEIWVCNTDGSSCGQLTSLHGIAGAARWSPDGRHIAFEFRPKEHTEIYIADVSGNPPRMLTTLRGADNGGPNWSRDGQWIYFYSNWGEGRFQLWKVPLQGGTPVQWTRNGGVFGAEDASGRFLYFVKFDVPGLWRMPLEGGEEMRLVDDLGALWFDWALGTSGIYFKGGENKIQFFELGSRKIVPIRTLEDGVIRGLTLSPDGKSLLYGQQESWQPSTIMLVKNFR